LKREQNFSGRYILIAEEFIVIDKDSPLWLSASSILDNVICFEQNDEGYSWNGWNKKQLQRFLNSLPARSSLIVGVWETKIEKEGSPECEKLVIGLVCEVNNGEVSSMRTFDALTVGGLKPSDQLEPGIEDAREIIRYTEKLVAPVAWALFTEKSTWDGWLLASLDASMVVDKGQQLATFAQQGRCVIMGNQAKYH
jgi:hypothetical protein